MSLPPSILSSLFRSLCQFRTPGGRGGPVGVRCPLKLVAAILLATTWVCSGQPNPSGSSVRSGPSTFRPGITVTLTNRLRPLEKVGMYTLTEIVPAGWTVGVISQGGSYDASKHWVRWLFMDNLARVVTFQLTQSSGSPTNAVLRGEASFDGMAVTITGLGVLPLQPPPSGVVVRQLPSAYRAGQTASVTLHVTPESDVGLYGVEEIGPRGWLPVNLGGGSLTAGGVIKWGPFPESTPRDLSYTLTAPAGAMSNVVFRGTGWFDTTAVTTGGDALMVAAPLDGGSV
ncbi:MAG: hypothetical protein WCR20_18275, partial [Verrucomicrobiota bacterium]